MSSALLVSAGEASGDRILARCVAALGPRVRALGMGGPALEAAGGLVHVPWRELSAMGIVDVVVRARRLRHAYRGLVQLAREHSPGAALLVGFTEFNQKLGVALRRLGIPVLWCVAPQVWAWRSSRLRTLRASVDRMAVILPFEEALWTNHGYDARYVGHPALDSTSWQPTKPVDRRAIAVLCGSRDDEARRLGRVLIEAAARWVKRHQGWQADLLLSPALSARREQELTRVATQHGVGVVNGDPIEGAATRLCAYELALCASGTASLEAVLSACPPTVAYRVDWLTAVVARLAVQTPHIALPNILIGERAFPEFVQSAVTVEALVAACEATLSGWDERIAACRRVRQMLAPEGDGSFGQRVADRLSGWI